MSKAKDDTFNICKCIIITDNMPATLPWSLTSQQGHAWELRYVLLPLCKKQHYNSAIMYKHGRLKKKKNYACTSALSPCQHGSGHNVLL